MKTYYVAVQSRGTVALPADLRRRLHLDEPGAQVEITEDDEGRIVLKAVLPTPADQAWFWTDQWQAMEREADADIAAGRFTIHDGVEEMFAHLDAQLDD